MRFTVGEINIPKSERAASEDSTLVRQDMGLFGIFDGMGGPGDGDVASRTVKETVEQFYEQEFRQGRAKNSHQAGYTARDALMHAQEALQQRASADAALSGDMGTTATIGCVSAGEDGIRLAYAHVGDSGLLVFHRREERVRFVTEEEADGHLLRNALSARAAALRGVHQYGAISLEPGDRLVFFTDGISGDTDKQRLSETEWREAASSDEPRAAAVRLVEASRKTDDRAVVVVDVN